MAIKNDNRLGFDPLAWMSEEVNDDVDETQTKKTTEKANVSDRDADAVTKPASDAVNAVKHADVKPVVMDETDMIKPAIKKVPSKKTAVKKVVTKKTVAKKVPIKKTVVKKSVTKGTAVNSTRRKKSLPTSTAKKIVNAPREMDMQQLLQESLDLLAPIEDKLTDEFYQRLFKNYPEVKPLFADVDWSQQGKKLMTAIKLVVKNVDKPDVLAPVLSNMGKKHQAYGVLPAHYPMVAESLLAVMGELAGDVWTDELKNAWTSAVTIVAESMIAAYETEENTMTVTANEELQRTAYITNAMTAAVMMVNLDLEIVYMNPAADTLMHAVEIELKKTLPNFNADKLIGFCIDGFHKDPSHQRRLLSNPNNLPWKSNIVVGHYIFGLNVTPVYNDKGEFIGACQEWTDETKNVANAKEAASLKGAIAGSETATMICDADLKITYMNDSVMSLLRNREKELQKVLPSFNVDTLIGTNIDAFHKNAGHQRALLSDPARLPYQTTIQVLDMYFGLNAIMLMDEDGKYAGNSVEWRDITEEKMAEKEVAELIEAASLGVLEGRLQTEKYSGFMATLGSNINTMLDAMVEPINETMRVTQELQSGNLSSFMSGDYSGTFKELKDAMNASLSNLSGIVVEIRTSAGQISSAAGEISQGNTDLSQRTEEQASSLEETASSMEELTSTVRQNAENSKQANLLAAGARQEAEAGGQVIDSTIEAMTSINAASNKIEDIISVIDEIAFQTNLLALNAAVEAARAGEQGRGFAVVASEVRSLAQRSAAAAKEIKVLIKDSVEKVDEGSRLVDESGKTLAGIVNSVKKVSDIIAEIAVASTEQSEGIDQVGKAITQLDEVTQQNAALVEQAAAASESMDEQASNLTKQMNFFNTGDVESVETSPAPRAVVEKPAPKARPVVAKPKTSGSKGSSADEWEEF